MEPHTLHTLIMALSRVVSALRPASGALVRGPVVFFWWNGSSLHLLQSRMLSCVAAWCCQLGLPTRPSLWLVFVSLAVSHNFVVLMLFSPRPPRCCVPRDRRPIRQLRLPAR
mgnify:CR=1 FL=1